MNIYEKLDQVNKNIISKILETRKILHIAYSPKSKILVDVKSLNKNDPYQGALFYECSELNLQYVYAKVINNFMKDKNIFINVHVNDDRLPYFKPNLTLTSDQLLLIHSSIIEKFFQ